MVRAEALGMLNQGCAVLSKLEVVQDFANLMWNLFSFSLCPWTNCHTLNSYRSNFVWRACRSPYKTPDIWNSRNGSNSYLSVGDWSILVNGKVWIRKALSSPREDIECCILFLQHKWMCLYCQGQLCSGWGAWLWSSDQPVLVTLLWVIAIGSLAKYSLNLQLQLLTFHLELQFSPGVGWGQR